MELELVRAMQQERANNAQFLHRIRVGGVTALVLLFCAMLVVGRAHWSKPFWPLTVWWAISAAFYLGRRTNFAQRSFSWLVPVLDMPMLFLTLRLDLEQTPHPGVLAGYALALYVLLLFVAALTLQRHQLVLAAAVGATFQAQLQVAAGTSLIGVFTTFGVLAFTAAICTFAMKSYALMVANWARGRIERERTAQELQWRTGELDEMQRVAEALKLREAVALALGRGASSEALIRAQREASALLGGREVFARLALPDGAAWSAGARPAHVLKAVPAPGLIAEVGVEGERDPRTLALLEAAVDQLGQSGLSHLLEERRQVDAAWKELRRFLDTASHELNSPVAAILSDARYVRRELPAVDAQVSEALLAVEASAERVAGFFKQLTAVLKYGDGLVHLDARKLLRAFDLDRSAETRQPRDDAGLLLLGPADAVLRGLTEVGRAVGPGPAVAGFNGRGLTIRFEFDFTQPTVPAELKQFGVSFSDAHTLTIPFRMVPEFPNA